MPSIDTAETKKPNPFTTVTKLSKIIALTLFVSLPFIGFYVGRNYQKSITIPDIVVSTPSNNAKNTPVDTAHYKVERRVLMTKEIAGGKIVAYRPECIDTCDFSRSIFQVVLEGGKQYAPVITSLSEPAYGNEDGLIEIVNNALWVVNGQTDNIDIYSINTEKVVDGTTTSLADLRYMSSINPPKYNIGKIDSVKCGVDKCTVNSAFHPEAGCQMILDIKSKTYSDIKCIQNGNEFTPEKS